MNIAIAHAGTDAAVVTVTGQLDIDTAPTLSDAFDELAAGAVTRIVADLSGLEFCDSIGLSAFVVAQRRCTDAGGWVRIAAPTPFLVRLLSIVGVADTVPMYRTIEGADRDDATDRIPPVTDGVAA